MGLADLVTGIATGVAAQLVHVFLTNLNLKTLLPARDQPGPGDRPIVISYAREGEVKQVRVHPPPEDVADMLSQILRSRRNWIEVSGAIEKVRDFCVQLLAHLGMDDEAVTSLARCGVAQVAFVDPNPLEESFPWEFVLAEATRSLRHASLQQDFLVTRYLQKTKRSHSKAHCERPSAKRSTVRTKERARGRVRAWGTGRHL
jgi:hypothetical protein